MHKTSHHIAYRERNWPYCSLLVQISSILKKLPTPFLQVTLFYYPCDNGYSKKQKHGIVEWLYWRFEGDKIATRVTLFCPLYPLRKCNLKNYMNFFFLKKPWPVRGVINYIYFRLAFFFKAVGNHSILSFSSRILESCKFY